MGSSSRLLPRARVRRNVVFVVALAVGGFTASSVACGSQECEATANCASSISPGAETDAGDEAEAETAGTPLRGDVHFLFGAEAASARVFGAFSRADAKTARTLAEAGLCKLTANSATFEGKGAGEVYVSGGALVGELQLSWGEMSVYEKGGPTPLFAKGDVLRARATGGEFPSFQDQNVVAPGPIVLTSPGADGGAKIPTNVDLTVAWTGGEAGAQIRVTFDNSSGEMLSCEFDARAGSGSVPASVLASQQGRETNLEVTHFRSTSANIGAHSLGVRASVYLRRHVSFQ